MICKVKRKEKREEEKRAKTTEAEKLPGR